MWNRTFAMHLPHKLCLSLMITCLPGCFDSARYRDVSRVMTGGSKSSQYSEDAKASASLGGEIHDEPSDVGGELRDDPISIGTEFGEAPPTPKLGTELTSRDTFLDLGLFSSHDQDGNGSADRSISLSMNPSTLSMDFKLSIPSFHKTVRTVKNEVNNIAVDFFIMLDSSGSMGASLRGAIDNISAFVSSLNAKFEPRVTLMHFRDYPTVYSFGPSDNAQDLINFLTPIKVSGGCEPGLDAINMAIDKIEEARNQGGMERFYVMVIITDEPSCGGNLTISTVAARLNGLAHQERIKLFGSLNGGGTRSFYTSLYKKSLTSVHEASRGGMDLAFPFARQAMLYQLVSKVEYLVSGPTIDLTCTLQNVSIRPLSGGLSSARYDFDASVLKPKSQGVSAIGSIGNLLKSDDPKQLKSAQFEGSAQYCCKEKHGNTLNTPAGQCVKTEQKRIVFSFDP